MFTGASAEISTCVLSYLDAPDFLQAQSSCQVIGRLARADALWKPMLERAWPTAAVLDAVGLLRGSPRSLYFRHRRLQAHANASVKLDQLRNALDVSNHALLVELRCGESILFSGVCRLGDRHDLTGVHVNLPPPRPKLKLTNSQWRTYQNSLRLSVTVVRCSDCKYMALCSNAEVRRHDDHGFESFFYFSMPPMQLQSSMLRRILRHNKAEPTFEVTLVAFVLDTDKIDEPLDLDTIDSEDVLRKFEIDGIECFLHFDSINVHLVPPPEQPEQTEQLDILAIWDELGGWI